MNDHQGSTQQSQRSDAATEGFTKEERAAIKERAAEVKAAGRRGRGAKKDNGESELLAKIAEMTPDDRALAERVHAIVTAAAPGLTPKLWYGMPAYARDGQVVCFFQNADKFKSRYATLGFNDAAKLDDGAMWPTAYALTALTEATEAAISDLVRRAVG